ncbi:MAG: hypothetical protein NUV86_09920, partial [Candidatus Scalindua sp.]|nr:hypothetical protein [Candidatus Scalindua sp.]
IFLTSFGIVICPLLVIVAWLILLPPYIIINSLPHCMELVVFVNRLLKEKQFSRLWEFSDYNSKLSIRKTTKTTFTAPATKQVGQEVAEDAKKNFDKVS